jgi:hypothetical protein
LGAANVKDGHLDPEIQEMIQNILDSNLRPLEKVFLILEWIFRNELPTEYENVNLAEFAKEAESFLRNKVHSDLSIAYNEAREIFKTKSDNETFLLLLSLSYHSYIDNEFVYDRVGRKGLLAKTTELGFEPSKVENLYRRWNRVAGTSDDLFNKI